MREIIIKELTLEDMATSAETVRAAFGTVAAEFGLTRENCPTNGAFTQPEHLAHDLREGGLMFGMYADGEQIGFVQLQQKNEGEFHLKKLGVLPEYRHHGYGRQLLDYIRMIVEEKGGTKISLGMIEENALLRDWYQANGFVHTGTGQFPQLPFVVGFMECEV